MNLAAFLFKEERKSTFKNWPISSFRAKCTVDNLAQCGFIYHPTVDSLDSTMCVFCLCEISNWNENDDPKLEHYRISPSCPLLNMPKDEIDWSLEDVITMLYKQSHNKLKTQYEEIEATIDGEIEATRKTFLSYLNNNTLK